jgi:hypothetical protein
MGDVVRLEAFRRRRAARLAEELRRVQAAALSAAEAALVAYFETGVAPREWPVLH